MHMYRSHLSTYARSPLSAIGTALVALVVRPACRRAPPGSRGLLGGVRGPDYGSEWMFLQVANGFWPYVWMQYPCGPGGPQP